ncbi:uncharacterized protein LOC142223808 [Haematobia irritans]|uniref:uncharacterized protein LOC142223808 n=1 Tax=Haematobia irritans TaxID=7368 RepID=UPI003F4FD694
MPSCQWFCVLFVLYLSGSLGQDSTTTLVLQSTTDPASTTKIVDVVSTNPSSPIAESTSASSLSNEMSSTSLNNKPTTDEVTTSSWELIYPDPKLTAIDDNPSSSIPPVASQNGFSHEGTSKYFKVDDVDNCEKYFGECLRQVFSNVMPKLRNDSPNGIDPFFINRTSFLYNGGPLNGRISVGYTNVYGLSSMKFRKVIFKRFLGNNFKIRLSTIIPKVLAKGSYKADLKVNSVVVRPNGEMNITLYGMAVEQLADGEIYREDEHQFLKLTSINVTTALRDAKINATGLVADTRLNDIILNVANNYWRDIYNIILPDTKDNWSPIIMNALNRVLSMVPLDFLK